MKVSGQPQARAALPPGKEPPVRIGWEAEWAPGPVWTLWRREKYFDPAGKRTTAVQPAARCYPVSSLKLLLLWI
jgi:hypothetical protein